MKADRQFADETQHFDHEVRILSQLQCLAPCLDETPGEACARRLDVPIEIKKQLRVPPRQNSGGPIYIFQVGLETLHLRTGQFCLQGLVNIAQPAVQFAHAVLQKPLIELGHEME
jgi:hypothetical protein